MSRAVAYARDRLKVPNHLYDVREAKKDAFKPQAEFGSMCLEFSPDKSVAAVISTAPMNALPRSARGRGATRPLSDAA